MKLQKKTDLLESFLATAKSYVGYRARPGGLSDFGKTVGYWGHDLPWSGAFIDVVARETGLSIPACVYSPSGLAEFAQLRRLRFRPRPGDIVFFSFATDKDFGMPHVGIVTDTSRLRETYRFTTVEAQVNSGLPRGLPDRDGVYERTRWLGDVIGFGRPSFKARPGKDIVKTLTDPVYVTWENVRPGRKNRDIETVQIALTIAADLRIEKLGTWDQPTREAFARFQRIIGFVGSAADGLPTREALTRLGWDTEVFQVKP
ncbi:endolysin [Actinomycetia phage DSL-LC01]|nr:endolysin [Actinomycetia phage DSL-LC01]